MEVRRAAGVVARRSVPLKPFSSSSPSQSCLSLRLTLRRPLSLSSLSSIHPSAAPHSPRPAARSFATSSHRKASAQQAGSRKRQEEEEEGEATPPQNYTSPDQAPQETQTQTPPTRESKSPSERVQLNQRYLTEDQTEEPAEAPKPREKAEPTDPFDFLRDAPIAQQQAPQQRPLQRPQASRSIPSFSPTNIGSGSGLSMPFLQRRSEQGQAQEAETSLTELLRGLGLSDESKPSPRRPPLQKGLGSLLDQRFDPTESMAIKQYRQNLETTMLGPSFRLGPTLGRTQTVDHEHGIDVARAFRSLEIKCRTNSVRTDLAYQRFHERPGLKRKRLASKRWRMRFNSDFRAVCRRVDAMRRQGW